MEQLRNWVNQTNVHRHKRDNKTSEWADSLLWKPIIYKYILKTTISPLDIKISKKKIERWNCHVTKSQNPVNANQEKKTILCMIPFNYKKKKTYWISISIFFVSIRHFFVGKNVRLGPTTAIKLHIHEVSMERFPLCNNWTWLPMARKQYINKRSKLPRIVSLSRMRKGDL